MRSGDRPSAGNLSFGWFHPRPAFSLLFPDLAGPPVALPIFPGSGSDCPPLIDHHPRNPWLINSRQPMRQIGYVAAAPRKSLHVRVVSWFPAKSIRTKFAGFAHCAPLPPRLPHASASSLARVRRIWAKNNCANDG